MDRPPDPTLRARPADECRNGLAGRELDGFRGVRLLARVTEGGPP